VVIESVAVVGSGLMGRGMAYAAALGGFRQHVQGGRLGKRVGRGVYEHEGK
jgi:hypothetical protein